MISAKDIYEKMKIERDTKFEGGLFDYTVINLSFNSNKIEGSTLTEDQTAFLYDYDSVAPDSEPLKLNDLIEMKNHFRLFNYMFDSFNESLSAELIKEFHKILKKGSKDFEKGWNVGEYKKLQNAVGNIITTAPELVEDEVDDLLIKYQYKESKQTLKDIAQFHVEFETIHPFQDGNGRIGRIIMFKECLKNDIVPFIITDDTKQTYYDGLRAYYKDAGKSLNKYFAERQEAYITLASEFIS